MKKLTAVLLIVALLLCGAALAKAKKLKDGEYLIGEDIDAGRYLLVCTKTEGGELNRGYDFLGRAMAGLGEKGLGDLYGALGDYADEVINMEVTLLNEKGKTVRSFELEEDEEEEIELTDGMTLKIECGKCTIEKIGEED